MLRSVGYVARIMSWLPPTYVARFYRIGRDSAILSDDEVAELRSEVRALVKEILERLGMSAEASGIGSLITSHTLEFRSNAADATGDDERPMRARTDSKSCHLGRSLISASPLVLP